MTRRIPLSHFAREALKTSYRKLAVDMGGPMRALTLRGGKPQPFFDIQPDYSLGEKARGADIMAGRFEYAGQRIDVGPEGDPWSIALPSERFAKWLHSFHWLQDLRVLDDTPSAMRARFLVDRWIEIYGKWNAYSWRNDILTPRLYATLVNWAPILSMDKLTESGLTRRISVVRQLKRLRKTFRRTEPGIERLRAAATLAIGGARISERSDGFLDRGLDWLDDQIDMQILPDGGHVSRSPEQTLEALDILLTLDKILNRRGVEGSRAMGRAIDRLLPAAAFFRAADGGLASFHGGSARSKRDVDIILGAVPSAPKPFLHCPHTGYHRISLGDSVLIMDTGSSPDYPYDKRAHLAPLAFELSNSSGRLIVNCGWTPQQPQTWARSMRSSSAHSTLTLDERSPGQLLPIGMGSQLMGETIANAAGPTRSARKDQGGNTWLEAAHDGYLDFAGLVHNRRLYVTEDGHDIRGEDTLSVPAGAAPIRSDEVGFNIRFHLHPDVKVTLAQDQKSALIIQPGKVGWRLRTDGGQILIEQSAYLAEGHRPQRNEQIVIPGTAFCDSDGTTKSNRVRWSLRRLEARK